MLNAALPLSSKSVLDGGVVGVWGCSAGVYQGVSVHAGHTLGYNTHPQPTLVVQHPTLVVQHPHHEYTPLPSLPLFMVPSRSTRVVVRRRMLVW